MKLLVGLGNPGPKYALTRHNIGFLAIDAFQTSHGLPAFRADGKALTCMGLVEGSKVLLAKPTTFMNLSGEAVRALIDFYKVPLQDLLVIQDDIDQAFGALRFQKKRGHGGHNGIRSIHQHLGTDDYGRLKIGVGRPSHPGHDVADYVLGNFSGEEHHQLVELLDRSVTAMSDFIRLGLDAAANQHNRKSEVS